VRLERWHYVGRRHLGIAVGTVLLLVAVGILVEGVSSGELFNGTFLADRRPALIVDDSVDAGFEALARETWDRFLVTFSARTNCFGDVHLRAVYALGSRAGYDPDTATVSVHVPGTPAKLQSALVHEWAHHVEFQCAAQQDLRPAFLDAQGLPPDTPWRPRNTLANAPVNEWADAPSEQFAEATVQLVLGGRPIPAPARVTLEAVRVVGEWAAGR
jgi:hypothetical protein